MKAQRVAFALTLATCAACSHVATPPPHVLRIADTSDPSSLNPLLAHDQDTIGFDLLWVQTLVGLDARNSLVPILVTRVPSRANGDISADGRTIVYRLRRNVRFADGRPLTSADVAFTFRAIEDPRNPVLSEDAYRRVAALTTPDAHTVIVRLRSPWNAAVRELFAQSDFAFGILPAHAFASTAMVGAPWEAHAFGTGPFRVTEWRRGERIVLEPNPYFLPRPRLSRLELRMTPTFDAMLIGLRTGELDVGRVEPAQAYYAPPNVRIVSTAINGLDYLALQIAAAPTDDAAVRRAIALALDVPVIERAFHGLYRSAAAFLPPVFRWSDAALRPIAHDDRAAAAALDRAGWRLRKGVRIKNGVPLDVLLVREELGNGSGLAAIIQRQLAVDGIRLTIKSFPPSTFNALQGPIRAGRFNMAVQGWIGGADPEQSVVFACGQIGPDGNNVQRFCDPRFEVAFRDQAVTPDEGRRKRDFITMQEIVYDRLPVIPLDYTRFFDAVGPRVQGFARNMLGYPVNAESWDAATENPARAKEARPGSRR
ncbi:MAG: peptide ABC transporter substrate-binding protein [Candidatus Eremiobacteraeota bacterium]|nr:peptide ABC transporter substrate-binding protein [Candidatus Eremiobacteraeota bacterium]